MFLPQTNTANIIIDLRNSIAMALGNQQLKWSNDGFAMLHAGDYNQDGNLDGTVQTTDYDTWLSNRSKIGIAEIDY